MSAVDLLRVALQRGVDPHRTALLDAGGARRSYAELDVLVEARASLLSGRLTDGSIHVVTAAATEEGVVELLAAWRCGAAVAPLHPGLTPRERAGAEVALADVRPQGQAVVWTSGTAGRARGVELSFEGLRASADAAAGRLALGPDDVWLCTLSPAHVGGLALVSRALLLGCTLALPGPWDAGAVWRWLERGVTHLSVVPTQLLRLLEARPGAAPPGTLRCVLVGGAHAPAELVRRALDAGWPLALTYGMTEMTSQVATAPPELVRRKPGTVGPPLEGVEVRLGDGGELVVRGATRALRYVGPDTPPLTDGEGWVRTGDVARLDDQGHLWIVGRRADRIVSGGVTVDAQEVEDELARHPAVAQVAVAGVPDPEWGEVVGAVVVGVAGELDLEELAAYARERLSAAKRPRRWLLVPELPTNAVGKVDRKRVRDLLLRDARVGAP